MNPEEIQLTPAQAIEVGTLDGLVGAAQQLEAAAAYLRGLAQHRGTVGRLAARDVALAPVVADAVAKMAETSLAVRETLASLGEAASEADSLAPSAVEEL